MTVRLYDGGGAEIEDLELSSFELVSEESAACDGLSAVFYAESGVEKIYGARTAQVYSGGEKVFFGYVDSVRAAQDENGLRVYVYARSSACLLVDSEAFPGQYSCPTSRQLWHMHARGFGFGFELPEIASQHDYVVTKGQSCFGAINTFMQYACGRGIYADAENNLRLLDSSGAPAHPDTGRLISASAKADRSSVIGRIDYKISSGEKYLHRLASGFAEKNGVSSRKLINLSALPPWQREAEAQRRITRSLEGFFTVTAVFDGDPGVRLAQRVSLELPSLGVSGELIASSIIRKKDEDSQRTTLVLRKETDGELKNYVAEQEI